MPYVVTNAAWFTAFNAGDFEGGAGTAEAGGPDISITTNSVGTAHTGTRKLLIDLSSALGGANVNADGYDRQKNLVKLKSGNPIVAARRYTISVWARIPNAGVSGPTNDLALYAGLGVYGFPTAGKKIGDFRSVFQAGVYTLLTGSINAVASVAVADAGLSFFIKWKQSQISPPIGGSGAPVTGAIIYYDTLNIVEEEFQAVAPPTLSTSKTDVSHNGAADGVIDLTVTGGVGPFTYAWSSGQSSQDISGLSAGSYSVIVTDTGTGLTANTSVIINEPDILAASLVGTNTTSIGADDGTIIVTVTGGSGNYAFLWNDAVTSQSRNNLPPGDYTVQITDLITGEQLNLSATISDPELVIKNGTFFNVHQYQSLRYVEEKGVGDLQNFDNTLFCKMFHPYMWKRHWEYVVIVGDKFNIQIRSDYPAHTCQLLTYGNVVVASFPVALKLQLKDNEQTFDMYATGPGTGDTPGETRVFFVSNTIPIQIALDQAFVVSNNLDGYNGSYTIQAVRTDATTGYPYLIINKIYTLLTPSTTMKATFLASLADYNVYEATHDFSNLTPGLYYGRIKALNPDESFRIAVTEPIYLCQANSRAAQETNLLSWTHSVNKDLMIFMTGIVHQVRVRSQLYKPKVKSQGDNYRQSDDDPIKLNNFVRRGWKFEVFLQPWFIHEAMSLAFGYDTTTVNNVSYFSEEGPAEIGERIRFGLNDNNLIIEERGWLKEDNGTGSDHTTGFLISQEGYVISQIGKIRRTH